MNAIGSLKGSKPKWESDDEMITLREATDIRNLEDIREMVDAFYEKVRADDILGVIFEDMAQVDWDEHLPLMYQFWATILLHREGYRGNPIEAHVRLDAEMRFDHGVGLERVDFERWLSLFRETIDERFLGPRAEMAKRGAARMSEHMMTSLML